MVDPPRKRTVTLAQRRSIAPSIYVLGMSVDAGDALRFEPGQFVTFYVPKDGVTVTRSYSISSSPERTDRFDLLVKQVDGGYVSTLLCERPEGERLNTIGPLGRFLLRDPGGRPVVFACTGTGIAPFLPMIDRLYRDHPEARCVLFFGTRQKEDLLFADRYREMARTHPTFEYVPALTRPKDDWTGEQGRIEGPIRRRFGSLADSDVYICGIPQMVQEVQNLAAELGCPKERTFVERY
jgi:ferredoxin-NADP reductase